MRASRSKIVLAIRNLLTGMLIVGIVSSAVFILYLVLLPSEETKPPIPTTETLPPVAQTPQPITQPPVLSQPKPSVQGIYTIYIASYVTERPAAEEVARWKSAGYSSQVVHANNHYRVSLGQYSRVSSATSFAKKMWEAFENGYWVGRIP